MPEVRALFGKEHIGTLLDLMETWERVTGETEAAVFRGAAGALKAYRAAMGEELALKHPEIAGRIDAMLLARSGAAAGALGGGAFSFTREDLRAGASAMDFERFMLSRHSVRNFDGRPVSDECIIRAVSQAQRSPSVCNRQSWRVHVFTEAADKAAVLRAQNGSEGFGHLASRILLVTSDLRTYVSGSERHQAFVDGGMFAMSLVLALHAQQISSCCLNADNHCLGEILLRRACRISRYEVPIMMLAVGYQPDTVRVAASTRNPTESILFFRRLG